ncbi:MAG: hypothetical protein ACTSU7_01865 [Candidatus Heimdallarchaeaceae archaeon]
MDRNEEIFIVAGGSSLTNFDFNLLRNKNTIVVNKAILDVPNPTFFITVDFTFLRKVGIHNIQSKDTTKVFIACLHFPYMQEQGGRIVDTRSGLVYDLSDFDMIIKSRADEGIGFQFKDFRNGLNSGFCALQFAVILGCKKIYLMGVDLCPGPNKDSTVTKTHYHGGYGESVASFSTKLEKYCIRFVDGIRQIQDNTDIEVISLSPISRLNGQIDYIDYRDVL